VKKLLKINTKFKKINSIIAISTFVVLLICSAFIFSKVNQNKAIAVLNKASNGSVEFVVIDGFSKAPVSQAKVVIVETGEVYYTDEFGKTPKILVPIVRDQRFDQILPKPWGEISVIFFKNGYVDYALFYLQVLEGETREGVEILMFSQENVTSGQPFSIIEGPNKLWVNAIIKQFKK
jgi:hypothetical protein